MILAEIGIRAIGRGDWDGNDDRRDRTNLGAKSARAIAQDAPPEAGPWEIRALGVPRFAIG